MVFIDAIFSVVQQLSAIGHKPDNIKISDKLLIRLHQSWAPIYTLLTLHKKTGKPEIELITFVLKQFEVNELLVAAPGPQVKAEQSEPNLAESSLYVKSRGGGFKGSKGHGRHSEECDWGNTKEREGVCWRCGREGHMARNCVADMPEEVKQKVINHALVADTDLDATSPKLFTFVSDTGDNPPSYSSRKRGKRKVGCLRKWIGEKGVGEFSW